MKKDKYENAWGHLTMFIVLVVVATIIALYFTRDGDAESPIGSSGIAGEIQAPTETPLGGDLLPTSELSATAVAQVTPTNLFYDWSRMKGVMGDEQSFHGFRTTQYGRPRKFTTLDTSQASGRVASTCDLGISMDVVAWTDSDEIMCKSTSEKHEYVDENRLTDGGDHLVFYNPEDSTDECRLMSVNKSDMVIHKFEIGQFVKVDRRLTYPCAYDEIVGVYGFCLVVQHKSPDLAAIYEVKQDKVELVWSDPSHVFVSGGRMNVKGDTLLQKSQDSLEVFKRVDDRWTKTQRMPPVSAIGLDRKAEALAYVVGTTLTLRLLSNDQYIHQKSIELNDELQNLDLFEAENLPVHVDRTYRVVQVMARTSKEVRLFSIDI